MGFDDLFEHQNNHKKYEHYNEYNNYNNQRYMNKSNHSHGYKNPHYLNYVFDKIKNNRKLQIWIGILGIILLIIIISSLIILIPILNKLVNYISQNGLQGLLNVITGFLDKIWTGTGK
jgi:hypothetical protein